MDKNYLVTKANVLVNANYDLSLQEQKLILTLASMVQPTDEEFKEYEFKIKDFMELLGVQDKSKYTEIPKITKELMKKVFEIKEGKDILQLSWLSSARYKTGEGLVILKFDSSLKPYMLQLKKLYTSYRLENILSLKSKYSLRLYEVLKSNQFKKVWEVNLEDLKKLLGATEKSYSVYQNVKNRIITQTHKELKEKTDISFDFEEIKTGRKVTAIRFYIHSNKSKSRLKEDELPKTTPALDEMSITLEEDKGIKNPIIQRVIKEKDIDYIEAKTIIEAAKEDYTLIEKVYNNCRDREVDNFVGYMVSILKNGFNEPKKNYKQIKFNNFEGRGADYYGNKDLEHKLLGWD